MVAIRTGWEDFSAAPYSVVKLPAIVRLRAAVESTSLPNKLKTCLGVSLIAAQIGDVCVAGARSPDLWVALLLSAVCWLTRC
jgi:hypothetical protein